MAALSGGRGIWLRPTALTVAMMPDMMKKLFRNKVIKYFLRISFMLFGMWTRLH
jgi:hypothetical protein